MTGELWYQTDCNHQFEDAIDFACDQTTKYIANRKDIKWVTIAYLNALQCACIFYLDSNDTTETATLTDKSAGNWLKWFRSSPRNNFPRSYLARPQELFDRCKQQSRADLSEFDDSVKWIIKYRNQFIHFYPTALSIELSGFPKTLIEIIQAIETITKLPRMYNHRFDNGRFNKIISRIKFMQNELTVIIKKDEESHASSIPK